MYRSLLLKKFLKVLLVKAENALMTTIRSEKYHSTVNLLGDKNVDVSCGDGVFTFLTMGGELSDDTDMFTSVDTSRNREGNFDTFDYFDDKYYISKIKDPIP